MRSSSVLAFAVALLGASAFAARAQADEAQGFATERFYPSSAGGGWFVMDALDMRGGLGGSMQLTSGYSRNPFRVTDGTQHLAVVSEQAFTAFGFALTYERFRLSLDMGVPLVSKGDSGTVGAHSFTGPDVDIASHPDNLMDARVGFDARLFGGPRDAFRLGAGAQLYVPNADRWDYLTDGTFRAMGRVLFAGDVGRFTYAGHVGVHVRPLDDSPLPGSPQGSELLFGLAAGARLPLRRGGTAALIVGPELYGATAFRSFFGTTGTALEALMTARVEGTADDGPQVRIKLGTGGGLNPRFGAPEWRFVFAVEVFDHSGGAR